jgi:hypothetical protein
MIRRLPVLALLLLISATTAPSYEPTRDYDQRTIEQWTVRVSSKLLAQKDLADRTLALLRVRLFEVNAALPAPALDKLRDTVIWVELDDPRFPGMCFHPSRRWLEGNGFNPDKAGGVEVGNAQHFLDWSREQPSMVLHELAHAYHHKVLGGGDSDVRAAYERGRASGKYDAVLRASGRTERHYALNNEEEFFAELSESYFGTNDFYPFVRAELRRHDPEGYDMIRRAWRIARKPVTTRSVSSTTPPPPPPPSPPPRLSTPAASS